MAPIQTTLRLSLISLLFLGACASPTRHPSSADGSDHDYPAYFRKARELLAATLRSPGGAERYSETAVIEDLDSHPDRVAAPNERLLEDIRGESANRDSTKHLRLIPPAGQPGYSDLKIFVSHPYYDYAKGKLLPAGDLVAAWRGAIQRAKKEIILNVFDFDLEEVAQDLIAQRKRGLSVQVGIDRNVISARPEVARVADLLTRGGVALTKVDPVSLNHQKVLATDWSDPSIAAVLLSSGNLTHSCLDPEGDLHGVRPFPKDSVPNANHVVTMKSWLLANLVFHELSKTFDPVLKLRGSRYPLTGAYQITGPGVDPRSLEAYPEPSLVITFTPGGGYGNINLNLLARVIEQGAGPVRMVPVRLLLDSGRRGAPQARGA
jgi:hypothetical protein